MGNAQAILDEVLLPIVAETRIAAPIEHVWEVLTSQTSVPRWLGAINYTGREGSTFHMQPEGAKRNAGDVSGATHCDLLLIRAPHKLDFSWYMPGTPQTLVEVSLFSEGADNSFVRLVHGGWQQFPADQMRGIYDQVATGWRQGVLPGLKAAAEAP